MACTLFVVLVLSAILASAVPPPPSSPPHAATMAATKTSRVIATSAPTITSCADDRDRVHVRERDGRGDHHRSVRVALQRRELRCGDRHTVRVAGGAID